MAKVRIKDGCLRFWCPGCNQYHIVPIDGRRVAWDFSGDENNPTLTPSILVYGSVPLTDDEHERIMKGEEIKPVKLVCHSYVCNGKIQFLSDCSHALAGQTVELREEE